MLTLGSTDMYAKLFQQVVNSSLTEKEPIWVRGVFFMLLAIADREGNVAGTDGAIARIINVPIDQFNSAVVRLMSPDLDSQSPEEEGRRLVRFEAGHGLRVVNYAKYQGIARDEQRRAYFRVKKQEQRAREAAEGTGSRTPPMGRNRGTNRPATVEEVIAAGQMLNLPEPACRKFWLHYEGTARPDENGTHIWVTGRTGEKTVGNWRSLLGTWKANQDERTAQEKTGGRTPREAQREPDDQVKQPPVFRPQPPTP